MMTKKYSAALTREQFLFRETRIVAQLMDEGLTDDAIYQKIMAENLFQLPTEKSMRSLIRPCLRRLRGLKDEAAVHMIAKEPLSTARQLCLYAMMRDSRLVADFLTAAAMIEMRIYPVSAKYHQNLVDVPMNVFSRSADCAKLDKNAKGEVESLIHLEQYVRKQLGLL